MCDAFVTGRCQSRQTKETRLRQRQSRTQPFVGQEPGDENYGSNALNSSCAGRVSGST
jgi:hypothetical protein